MAYATDRVPFWIVDAPESLPVIVTVTETKQTPSASVVEPAVQMQTAMASVTMSIRVSVKWTPVAYAMDLAPSTIADVPKSLLEIATATATLKTPSAYAEEPARPISTETVSATQTKFLVVPMKRRATTMPTPPMMMVHV